MTLASANQSVASFRDAVPFSCSFLFGSIHCFALLNLNCSAYLSMFKYLYKIKDGQRVPCLPQAGPLLPSPDNAKTPEERHLISAVNKHINKQLSVGQRGNKGKYNKLDDDTRNRIAKKYIELGPAKTVRYFNKRGLSLNESTVRSVKKSFCAAKASQKTDTPHFSKKKRGRKLLLGDLDSQVLTYVKQLRIAGGIINRTLLYSGRFSCAICLRMQYITKSHHWLAHNQLKRFILSCAFESAAQSRVR